MCIPPFGVKKCICLFPFWSDKVNKNTLYLQLFLQIYQCRYMDRWIYIIYDIHQCTRFVINLHLTLWCWNIFKHFHISFALFPRFQIQTNCLFMALLLTFLLHYNLNLLKANCPFDKTDSLNQRCFLRQSYHLSNLQVLVLIKNLWGWIWKNIYF